MKVSVAHCNSLGSSGYGRRPSGSFCRQYFDLPSHRLFDQLHPMHKQDEEREQDQARRPALDDKFRPARIDDSCDRKVHSDHNHCRQHESMEWEECRDINGGRQLGFESHTNDFLAHASVLVNGTSDQVHMSRHFQAHDAVLLNGASDQGQMSRRSAKIFPFPIDDRLQEKQAKSRHDVADVEASPTTSKLVSQLIHKDEFIHKDKQGQFNSNCSGQIPLHIIAESPLETLVSLGATSMPVNLCTEEALVKLMCSFGGRILSRPSDGKLRYVGGETHIVAVNREISYNQFMCKMVELYGQPLGLKYQLPDQDLDALVSVTSNDDFENMMEEFKKLKAGSVDFRLRLFFFLSPLEVELYQHVGTVSKKNCINFEQQYVDAINGVLEQTYTKFHEEEDGFISPTCTPYNAETSARLDSHALSTVQTSLKGPSVPSSCPSSPSLVSRQLACLKQAGASDANSGDRLSNATLTPRLLVSAPEELDQDASGDSLRMPCFEHQLESLRMMCYEAPGPKANSRQMSQTSMHCRGNLSKHACQSEQYIHHGTATGGHVEQMQDMYHSPEHVAGHGETGHYYQHHKPNFCNLSQQNHHQQRNIKQQGLACQPHMSINSRKAEILQYWPGFYAHSQGSSQLHQQTTHHHTHQTLNNYNLNQGSELSHPRISLASAPMVHLRSAPSSPRVARHDKVGRCSCGYLCYEGPQRINVLSGHSFRPVHVNDKPAGNTGLLSTSRGHTCDPYTWQQHSFFTTPIEIEQQESMREMRQHSHGMCLGNCVKKWGDVPLCADACFRIDMSNEENPFVCLCTGCYHHGIQNTEKATQFLQSNEQDTLADWSMDEGQPFPYLTHGKMSFHHHENTRDEEKCTKGNSSPYLNYAQGKCESKIKGMAGASLEDFARRVNRAVPLEKELVAQETSTYLHRDSDCDIKLLELKSSTSLADLWNMPSYEPIVWGDDPFSLYAQSRKLLDQDSGSSELSLIHSDKFAETCSVRAVHHEPPFSMTESTSNTFSDKFSKTCSVTAVDSELPFNMIAMEISFNAFSSPVYDQSPLRSKSSSLTNFEKEASHMSVTRHLADAMISSVLESFSTEDSDEETKKMNSGMAGIIAQKVVNSESHQACEVKTPLRTRIGPAGAWSDNKDDKTIDWLEAGIETKLSTKLVTGEHSGITDMHADKERNVDSEDASSDKFKDLLLLQAEAEAIARDLQEC